MHSTIFNKKKKDTKKSWNMSHHLDCEKYCQIGEASWVWLTDSETQNNSIINRPDFIYMSCLWKLIMEDNQNRVKMNKEKTLHNYTDKKS
jgi:hypothetical protein